MIWFLAVLCLHSDYYLPSKVSLYLFSWSWLFCLYVHICICSLCFILRLSYIVCICNLCTDRWCVLITGFWGIVLQILVLASHVWQSLSLPYQSLYFVGPAIVFIITMFCDCVKSLPSTLWTATVDSMGIIACSLEYHCS